MATASPDARPRVGLFGGTFDPPHVGHVTVAADVADALGLDRVWWMVADRSPFKRDGRSTPSDVRLEMVRAATAVDPRFEARDDELRRGGISYTVDTLRALRARHADTDFFLIVGADQAARLHEWKEPEALLELATLVVMDRRGNRADAVLPSVDGVEGAIRVPVTRVDVSSTEVRGVAAGGGSLEGLVPDAVRAVVERAGLYRPGGL